ncbi:MAG: xylulokinase [Akkermansiaceae bacterium]
MHLGIDSSTQSLSGLVINVATGEIVAEKSVNFGADLPQYGSPQGFLPGGADGEVHAQPRMWLAALDQMLGELADLVDLSQIRSIGGSGQQHGSVYLNGSFSERVAKLDPRHDLVSQLQSTLSRDTSPIWMDTSTGSQCREIATAMGGDEEVCARSGSTAIERFTGPQIRKFWQQQPAAYESTARIHLVSSFLCSVLAGCHAPIDFGDGAGMNLMNLASRQWDHDLLDATAPMLRVKLPELAAAGSVVGPVSDYFVVKYGFSPECRVGVFTGDNPASLVGMGATTPGQVVISLGTSDTFFAGMSQAYTDPRGFGHVFGNPGGGYMCLVCFRNGSLAREALRDQYGLDWSAFDRAALAQTPPGNDGNLMLPFFGPEITPRRNADRPTRAGSATFVAGESPAHQVRALLEGQFLNMRLHTDWIGINVDRILLTGGASRNDGIAQIVADVFGAPVERLAIANSAALGAAILAAVTSGYEMSAIQSKFSHTASDSRIDPNPDVDYTKALASYIDLLDGEV